MNRVEQIRRPPDNFDQFVEEVAEGLSELYGPAAADDYRSKAPASINASLSHPAVRAWAAFDEATDAPNLAKAILVSAVREGMGHITFLHVVREYVGEGVEARLVEAAVNHLRDERIGGIAAEPVALCPLSIDGIFERLAFKRIERQLMTAPLGARQLAGTLLLESIAADPRDYGAVADVIVAAYDGHPGRELHAEVRSQAGAESFVRSAADGVYGLTRPAYIRVIRRTGRIAAAIVGCEAAPGIGFVLQVVVSPEFQNQGLGTRLLIELANVFRETGLSRIALGVTVDNPARCLYERLGFRKILPVNAYVWWK